MSSMLEEAIIDAEALKEAAKKSAEEKIIEHFSKDIKEAVDLILEQDFGGLDPLGFPLPDVGTMAPTTPFASPSTVMPGENPSGWLDPSAGLIDMESEGTDTHEGESLVKQTPYATTTADRDVVSLDLDKLEESIQKMVQAKSNKIAKTTRKDEENYEIDDILMEDLDDTSQNTASNQIEETMNQIFAEEMGYPLKEGEAYQRDECTDNQDCGADEECVEGHCAPSVQQQESLEKAIRDILAEEMDDLFEERPPSKVETAGLEEQLKQKWETKEAKKKKECPKNYDWLPGKYVNADDNKHGVCKKPSGRIHGPPTPDEPKKEHKQLNNKLKFLEQKLNKYQEVFPQLKQQLEESSLQNARLHYQNRILNSASLNERQKDRLVETISKANTVEEAKIIYETLQSAVGASAPKRQPKSLNEVVTKRSSAFMPRKEEKRVDTLAARMKALAGITDK